MKRLPIKLFSRSENYHLGNLFIIVGLNDTMPSEILADPSRFRSFGLLKTENYLEGERDRDTISDNDCSLIAKYVLFRAGKNISQQTLHNTACILVKMSGYMGKEYRSLDAESLQNGVTLFNTGKIPTNSKVHAGRSYKANTRVDYINVLKSFLLWCNKNQFSKIKVDDINEIQPPKNDKQTFGPQDILSKSDIEAVISACDNVRDRAFISALFDGGFRSIELCTMTWGDLNWVESEEHEGRYIVAAHTSRKTGIPRRILLTRSGAFLNEWRNLYKTYTGGLEPEGENVLFVNRKMKPFSYTTVSKIIDKLKRKVKEQGLDLDKKLKPHSFRRASITHEANDGRPISHICMERWGKSYSPQIIRYNQPDLAAIDSTKMELSGIPTKRKYERHIKVLEPISCPGCGFVNKPLNQFCGKCGSPLTEEAKQKRNVVVSALDSAALDELSNEELGAAIREYKKNKTSKSN